MKKILYLLLVAVLVLGVSGCTTKNDDNTTVEKNTTENGDLSESEITVYTSIYPMYDFATKIAGDKINVVNLVPAGVEPHEWEPSTQDMMNISNSSAFIYSGAGMEGWVEKVIDACNNDDMIVLEASQGIELINDDEETVDPHVWLSIKNAKKEMENIKNIFIEIDSENAEYYEENYNYYAEIFDDLNQVYDEELSKAQNKNIIVAHKSFAYLCNDFGLTQVAIEGLTADSEPDPSKMTEIINFAKDNNIKVIFFEELVNPKVSQSIANEIGAETMMLNPVEGITDEQIEAGEDYVSIMEENLESLKVALEIK